MTQGERRALRKKRLRRRKKLQSLCVVLAMVLVALLVFAAVLKLTGGSKVITEATVEAGMAQLDPYAFIKEEDPKEAVFRRTMSREQLSTLGTFGVELEYDGKLYEIAVTVVDTVAPQATAVNGVCTGTLPDPAIFVTDIVDATAVTVTYAQEPDISTEGDKQVTVLLTDAAGNTTRLSANMSVVLDTVAPTITGVAPITVYAGDAVSYRANIQVADDLDPDPTLTVDNSAVDLSKPGTYTVTYIVTDAAGNTTSEQTTVEVKEKQDWYVDIEVIYEKVDDLLDKLIGPNMTKREQVKTIYQWARSNCSYSGHSDKSDYLQGAYVMLTQRAGDCFNYFAVTKLMFERLGIDNIDVHKVKNYDGDSNHYWSLVSLDDGQTWYHFDATPRMGTGDDFCLVTDAFLDAYSASHKNSHNRDKSLYPATPAS